MVREAESEHEEAADPEPEPEIGLEELGEAYSSEPEEPVEPEELTSRLFEKLRREAQGLDDPD